MKKAPNSHDAIRAWSRPPPEATARMTATGPLAANANAIRPLPAYCQPKSARRVRIRRPR
ncbi:MAG: hypothetical protein AB7P21_18955 [Lautropia sp.]